MRPFMFAVVLLGLVACGERELDPLADEDGDGFSNGDELALGSDPRDDADTPYAGGWSMDAACRKEVQPTGNDEGQIAEDFALVDQYGETFHLHDFCDHVLLVEFSGFT